MRVVLADDLFLIRDGLTRMLEAFGSTVVAAVDNPRDLLTAVSELEPDIAVIDVRMPPTFTDEGLRAALEARRLHPGLPVLILSQYVEPWYARELLADGQGSVGYLLKDRVMDVDQFLAALELVAAGGTAMDPQVIARVLEAAPRRGSGGPPDPARTRGPGDGGRGRSNAAVATALCVTERAVNKHISSIFARLGLPPSSDDHRRVLAVLAYLHKSSPVR